MDEKKTGQTAARMVQRSLRQAILSRGLNNSDKSRNKGRKGDDLPLSKSRGLARMRKDNNGELKGIAVRMGRHGFILNNGVDVLRRSGIVKRTKPRTIFYSRKQHPFKIKSYSFIDEAVQNSGAIPYLKSELARANSLKFIEVLNFDS